MSNTGRNKKLASFNCDEELWERFRKRCQEKGTTATATLIRFISLYLDSSLDNLDAHLGNGLDKQLSERVRASVDEYLVEHFSSYLDKYLATNQDWKELHSTVVTLSQKIEELENQGRSSAKRYTKKREYWFIKERAKYLGLHISAAQLIHIEMFANDYYKSRHGKLPEMQLYRNIQAFAYPEKDVDLLDAAIKKVVEM